MSILALLDAVGVEKTVLLVGKAEAREPKVFHHRRDKMDRPRP
jgi:hypothetical protein